MVKYNKGLKYKVLIPLIIGGISLLFLVIGISLLTYNKLQKYTLETITQKSLMMNSELNRLLEDAEKLYFLLRKEEEVKQLGSYSRNNNFIYYEEYMLRKVIEEKLVYLLNINSSIDSIYIYFENISTLITSEYGSYGMQLTKKEYLLERIRELDRNYSWTSTYEDEISHKNYISLVGKVDLDNKYKQEQVFICINYEAFVFENILENLRLTHNTKIFLWDKEKEVIAATENYIDKGLTREIEEVVEKNGEKIIKLKYDNQNYYLLNLKEYINNWKVTVLMPQKELWKEELAFRNMTLIVVIIVISIIIFIMINIIIKCVDQPLARLIKAMKKVEKGEFNSYILEKREDEFGYVYISYNHMLENLNILIEESYANELIKKELQISSLQKQINPHFLYNTLDTICAMIYCNQTDNVNNIIGSLADMYRMTFNKGKDLIKCKDMIYGIECYLTIYKLRQGGLEFAITLDKDLEEFYVLNLIIQTVVENAIVHGISEVERTGNIIIKAIKEKNYIKFIVEDNGIGMREEKLELIIASLNYDTEERSGLKNVQKRLKLYYGEECGIKLESKFNIGTKVTIILPYK